GLPPTAGWRMSINLPALLGGIQRALRGARLSEEAKRALIDLRQWWQSATSDRMGKAMIIPRINQILADAAATQPAVTAQDPFGAAVGHELETKSGERLSSWFALLRHAATAASSSPSRPWQKAMARFVDAVGRDEFQQKMVSWLGVVAAIEPVIHGYALGFPT